MLTLGDIESFGDGSQGCDVMLEVEGKLYIPKSIRWRGKRDYTAIISTEEVEEESKVTNKSTMRVALVLSAAEGNFPFAAWFIEDVNGTDDLEALQADWNSFNFKVLDYNIGLEVAFTKTIPTFLDINVNEPEVSKVIKEVYMFLKNHPNFIGLKITRLE